jgi:hypothetical protein
MNGWKLGLLTGQKIKKRAEVQISNVLMPFWWNCHRNLPLIHCLAMSLKSKWSQRMYELCQKWQGTWF